MNPADKYHATRWCKTRMIFLTRQRWREPALVFHICTSCWQELAVEVATPDPQSLPRHRSTLDLCKWCDFWFWSMLVVVVVFVKILASDFDFDFDRWWSLWFSLALVTDQLCNDKNFWRWCGRYFEDELGFILPRIWMIHLWGPMFDYGNEDFVLSLPLCSRQLLHRPNSFFSGEDKTNKTVKKNFDGRH